MPGTTSEIDSLTESNAAEIVEVRRHLHRNPELGWQEDKTSAHLQHLLQRDGIEVTPGPCGASLIAHLEGMSPGPTVAIRADMDALPVLESNDVSYVSQEEGVMHACGHDCHMAMLYGVAKVLKQSSVEFPGRIRFIFQPCEESTPSGASQLVEAGVVDEVDAIFAYHVDPEIPVGKIGLRTGVLTARCNEFDLTLLGRSGHAARPHQTVDATYVGTKVLNALYDVVGNRTTPFVPAVMTVGQVAGGRKANVISDEFRIKGTIRTLDEASWVQIQNRMERVVASIADSFGARYKLEFLLPIPSVRNDAGLITTARRVAETTIGSDNIVELGKVSMGGEDFSWYLTRVKGALIRLGVRRGTDPVTPLHASNFDVDERALPLGTSLMARIVLTFLQESGKS